jgi:hypothetical protein
MPDQFMTVVWLLAGGLVVVLIALGAVGAAFLRLRRDSAAGNTTAIHAPKPSGHVAPGAISKDDIRAVLREELAAFQAVYRADLAQIVAGKPGIDAPAVLPEMQGGLDRLDHAIALARAGHDADFIGRTCDFDPADAEALVRFNGPGRALAASSQL